MSIDLIAHAMRLSEQLGTPVFPVRVEPDPKTPGKTTKRPLVPGWQNGGAVSTADGIETLFAAHPYATNVGMVTGGASRIFVIDLDGEAGIKWWQAHAEILPPTRTQQTQREHGLHLFYRLPVGVEIRNSAGHIAPGVDIRGTGGFICDWSALHPPVGDEIADAPAALIELLTKTSTLKDAAKKGGHGTILEGTRNDSLARLAGQMRRSGFSVERIEAALLAFNEKECKPPLPDDEVATIAASVGRYQPASEQPVIEIRAGELPRIIDEAEAAMLATGDVYQRGEQLVRIVRVEEPKELHGVKRPDGSLVISAVDTEWLTVAFARTAAWVKFDPRSEKKFRSVDPPSRIAASLLSLVGEWRAPVLRGIVEAPTIRQDGSLIAQPGYDIASGLFAAFDPDTFPIISPLPSRDDAQGALDALDDLFSEFPFVGGSRSAHASVAIAAIITACIRKALNLAPAFAVSAHDVGSGKTTLAESIGQVALGRRPPAVAPTEDEAELAKRLFAILLAGDGIIVFDNFVRPVESACLCALLTSETYCDRILGVSKKATAPTTCTWFLTGNNLEIVGDLTERVLVCALDPQVENPGARPFKRDLAAYIAEHRGRLVAAALTIPLAYLAAGSPAVEAPGCRFRQWDALVRRPMLWLNAADPLGTQAELKAHDPIRSGLIGVLTAWNDAFGTRPTTVAQAIETATAPGQAANALHDALIEVAGDRDGKINPRRLGRYLARSIRRIEQGCQLEEVDIDRTTCRKSYRVTSVNSVVSIYADVD